MRAIRIVLLLAAFLIVPITSFGAFSLTVTIAPPPLLVYSQPICPGPNYMWVPGYWAYGPDGYYWVPGTWVLTPFTGALWTPGYWGWGNGAYLWHDGYWGLQVGFYGGINYGFGYSGIGYDGGYWSHGAFYYNRAVNNVNTAIVRNVYSRAVRGGTAMSRVSYNGGRGGTSARPTATELSAARARRSGPIAAQTQLRQAASMNRAQLASVNHDRPAVMATPRASAFTAQHGARPIQNSPSRNVASNTQARPAPHNNPALANRQTTAAARTARGNTGERYAAASPSRRPARNTVSTARPAAPQSRSEAQRTVSRTNVQSHRAAAPQSHAVTRNNSVARSAPQYRAPARQVASHANAEPRHVAAPPSHSMARNAAPSRPPAVTHRSVAPAPHTAQHENLSRPQAAPRSAPHESAEPKRKS